MSNLSDFQRNSVTLRAKAGSTAIAQNDLLLLNAAGQLYPVVNTDTAAVGRAGGVIIPTTTPSAFTPANITTRKEMFVAPADGSIFIATAHLTATNGLTLYKYSSSGSLLGSLVLDATNSALSTPIITQLSNGNLMIAWVINGLVYNFIIVDVNLNLVVAKTQITANISTVYHDAIALSGGGFAVCYSDTTSTGIPALAIFSNAGSVVFAATNITSAPNTGVAVRLAQLSNGNIAMAIYSLVASKALGRAISSAVGATVMAYTVSDATSGATIRYPAISAIVGFFAIAAYDDTATLAYVYSLAGALQGGAATAVGASTITLLFNDGVAFWLTVGGAGITCSITFLPSTGTGFVTSPITTVASAYVATLDRGFIVVYTVTGTLLKVYQLTSAGEANLISNFIVAGITAPTGLPTMAVTADHSVALMGIYSSNTFFSVLKYFDTAVVGVADAALAGGNAGTLVNFDAGQSAYPINPILGTPAKAFDNSSGILSGNGGVMYSNSVALRGVGQPGSRRNIN